MSEFTNITVVRKATVFRTVVHCRVTKRWRNKDGKRRQCTRSFHRMTDSNGLEPYSGQVKTIEQLSKEMWAEADAWLAEPEN